MPASTSTATNAHNLAAAPTTLSTDLAFIASLSSSDHLSAFCNAARELLAGKENTAMFAKAGKALGVDATTVSNSVHALCHVFVSAATAGRAAADVLHGLDDVPLPAESRQALIDFYSDVAPELEKELRRGLDLPRYRALEWRLQVKIAGRYAPRQAPQPSVLMRLHTAGGAHGAASEHLLQADLTTMRRLTSELETALAEDKSTHSRRVGRRL